MSTLSTDSLCCSTQLGAALASGLAGAAALTAVHEAGRRLIPHAPRVDVLGERALASAIRSTGHVPPPRRQLYGWTLAGDLLLNGLLFSLVGMGPRAGAPRRGLLLGLLNGAGSLGLAPLLGLGRQPNQKTPLTQVLTLAWFALGGWVAGATLAELRAED